MVGPETYDTMGEREAFERILARKPTGILVSAADPVVMTPVIDAAITQGVPVITMDSDAPASKRLMFIGTNNLEVGRMAGHIAAKRLGGKGNVLFFTMPEQTNLKERLNGYLDAFSSTPEIMLLRSSILKVTRASRSTARWTWSRGDRTPWMPFSALKPAAVPQWRRS